MNFIWSFFVLNTTNVVFRKDEKLNVSMIRKNQCANSGFVSSLKYHVNF